MSKINGEQIIEVTFGTTTSSFLRKSLIEVKESHDGLVFTLRDGMSIAVRNDYISTETKIRVTQAVRTFGGVKKLKVNLNNATQPVGIEQ